jgi:fatty-acyl-CoA synthase
MASEWTLAVRFAHRVQLHPERVLVRAGDRSLTYGQAESQAAAFAATLQDLGIGAGDRVAVLLPNCSEWVITLLGTAQLGAVVVPVSPHLNVHELKYQLRHAEASVLVTIEKLGDVDYLQRFEQMLPDLPDLHYVVTVGDEELWYDDRIFQFEDVLSKGSGRSVVPHGVADGDDLAQIYTSGTMGKPKGVRSSHRALIETAVRSAEVLEMTPDDRVFAAVPLYASFGFSVMIGTLVTGATLVLQPTFDAAQALDLLVRERITVLNGVPTTFHLLMREPSFTSARLDRLRTGIIAGGPVTEELVRRVRRWCDALVAYGLTETGPTVAITRFGDSDERRTSSVGRPLPGVEVMAVDVMTGALHGPEAVGELAVRGPGVMSGYARMPQESARAFTPEGYFLTGDLGIIDEDGYLRIVGRRQETIHRGGFQIHPREVEDKLRSHPAVEEVCVIGVPHDVLGELICACIVPVEGAVITGREITRFAHDTMAEFKVPDLVRFFDAFPRTGNGTIKRRELARTIALDHTALLPSSS